MTNVVNGGLQSPSRRRKLPTYQYALIPLPWGVGKLAGQGFDPTMSYLGTVNINTALGNW